jgi:predicted nucleotidyltransferase
MTVTLPPSGRQTARNGCHPPFGGAAHEVTNLRVFGSVARGEDRLDSEVDLLVHLPPHMGLLGLGRVLADLEAILGTKVDLVPASDLKPAVRARATSTPTTWSCRPPSTPTCPNSNAPSMRWPKPCRLRTNKKKIHPRNR